MKRATRLTMSNYYYTGKKRTMGGFYHICPHCGASLDPGEACDCLEEKAEQKKSQKTPKKEKRAS